MKAAPDIGLQSYAHDPQEGVRRGMWMTHDGLVWIEDMCDEHVINAYLRARGTTIQKLTISTVNLKTGTSTGGSMIDDHRYFVMSRSLGGCGLADAFMICRTASEKSGIGSCLRRHSSTAAIDASSKPISFFVSPSDGLPMFSPIIWHI